MEQNQSGKNGDGEPDVETEKMRDDMTRFFRLKDEQKKMNDDLQKMTAARESTEHIAEDFGRHIASEITGFGSMLKSSQQSIKAVEEKLLRLADEMGSVRKANSETASRMAALEQQAFPALNELRQRAVPALNEKLSRQEELGRAVMAVLDDFKAHLSDYPTRGEIEPLWKEAEAVMLDDLNRQRADMKALLAALAEDYRDGALSEKTYIETKGKTEEKLAVLEDKARRFAAAVSGRSEAKRLSPLAPAGEKEKLAEAKLSELRQREGRFGALEKRLDEFSRQMANFNQAVASNSTRLAALENGLLRMRAVPSQPMTEKGEGAAARPGIVGGLLGRILSAGDEEKPAGPKRREEEAPPKAKMESPAIMPEGGRETRLKREVEELESALARLREKKSGGGGEPFLLKLKEQKQELETLLKIVEKRHMDGEIASESYGSIRARTLERLQKINELLSSGQKRNPYG